MAFNVLTGGWPDVIETINGYAIVRVLRDAAGVGTVVCEENGVEIWRRIVTTGLRPKMLRCAANTTTGEVKAIVTCAIAGNFDRAVLIAEAAETDLGINTFAAYPVMLTYEGGDFVAYLVINQTQYRRWPLAGVISSPIDNPFAATGGTIVGIRDVVASTVLWDQTETGQAGVYAFTVIGDKSFYHYRTRDTVTVGTQKGPPDTPEGVIASPDGVGVSTLINVKAYNPTLANVTVGPRAGQTVVVAFIGTSVGADGAGNVATFYGPPWPDYSSVQGTGLLGLSGLYQQPVVQRENLIITKPWYLFLIDLVKQVFGPIDLGSAQVQGMLPPENGGTGGNTGLAGIVDELNLITGLTGDIEATGPGVADATIVRQYVPMTTGAIPGEILFVGGDVMLVKTTVP